MKIVRFLDVSSGAAVHGILEDDSIFAASGDLFSGISKGERIGTVSEVKLLSPLDPKKIVCVGLNYAAHVTERDATRKIPDEPVLFMKPTSAVVGPDDPIQIAYPANETQHEAELVVVIGKTADNVTPEESLDYVLGFTAGNDVSDRTLQKKDGQWIRAKGFRSYGPLGPCIETDFDLSNAAVISRVNGEVRQSQTTASMLWNVPTLISYISGIMTLEPGDIIMTGTPEGVGPLVAGDICEIEIAGIGILRNPVTAASNRPYQAPPART